MIRNHPVFFLTRANAVAARRTRVGRTAWLENRSRGAFPIVYEDACICHRERRAFLPARFSLPLGKKVRETDSVLTAHRDSQADPSDPRVAPVLIVSLSIGRSDEIITNPTQHAPHPTLRSMSPWPSPAPRASRAVIPVARCKLIRNQSRTMLRTFAGQWQAGSRTRGFGNGSFQEGESTIFMSSITKKDIYGEFQGRV